MGKRCKCPAPGPNNGYLISFGDTMTALLAFFIVLNSLAEEQTGANLHAGTGSFIRVGETLGLSGITDGNRSRMPFQFDTASPLYFVADPDNRIPEKDASGPDDIDDAIRVIDREQEQFHRFLDELKRLTPPRRESTLAGEVAFDVLGKLPANGSPMTEDVRKAIAEIGVMLRKTDYSLQITVWATTPSQSAWTRAVRQAAELRDETIRMLRLTPAQQARLSACGRSWISSDIKRPAVSLNLRRLSP